MKRAELAQYIANLETYDQENLNNLPKEELRAMSSNILHNYDHRSTEYDVPYEERMKMLAATYLYFKPDFLGLQEVSYLESPILLDLISEEYATPETSLGDVINYRDTSPTNEKLELRHNHTPLLYRKDKYEVIDSRFHYFSPVVFYGYHWALYRFKEDPSRRIIHMNLHFFSGHPSQHQVGVIEANRELIHLRRHYPTVPIVVTGDYNMNIHSPSFPMLLEGTNMETGMLLTDDNEKDKGWFHAMGDTTLQCGKGNYDHVSVTKDLIEVKRHRVLINELLAKASDHCPMFIDFTLKN